MKLVPKTAEQLKEVDGWESFCKVTGRDPNKVLDVSEWDEDDREAELERWKIAQMLKWANGGGWPNWRDSNEEKWTQWMVYDPSVSAFRFYVTYFANAGTRTAVGARLAAANDDVSTWAGNDLKDMISKAILG
jgi:hypothetical protein